MPHILVAGPLHPKGQAILENAPDFSVHYTEGPEEASYAPYIQDAHALLLRTQPLGGLTIANAAQLQLVSRHGVGYDAVDVAALSSRKIPLAVCGDVNSSAVAEHAVMMILALSKSALRADTSVRTGNWFWRNRLESRDLRGQRLLIIGYGRIGQQIARMMQGFDVHITAYDPYLVQQGWPKNGVPPVHDLHAALTASDIVSLSTPHSNTPILNAAAITRMKPGAIVVNTARGSLIDEVALITALQTGHIAAAGLDVFEEEPLPPSHPFSQMDQVLLSPHIAGVTQGAAERMAVGSAQNIVDFFGGKLERSLVVNKTEIGFER